jgi:AcrR family transcriptional regulator
MWLLPIIACTPYSCQVTSPKRLDSRRAPARDEGERTRLTRRTVVDRALQLADADGLDALTIRKLAQELRVTPMALYWHFRGKDELLEGLAEQVWAGIDVNVDRAAPWPAQLRALLESLLRVLRAHPAAPQLLLQSEKQSESALRATEVTLEVLRSAGFDPKHASEIARSALWTGITLVMSEPGITMLSAEERVEFQRRKQVVLATLPAASYPRLVECAVPMTACDDPEFHYELGIGVFVAGVEAIAAAGEQG